MKRKYGSGNIEQLPSGHFRVRFRLADGGRKCTRAYETHAEAQRILNAALVELTEAEVAPTGAVTLRGFGARWLERKENSGDYRNIGAARSVWKNHVMTAPFADWPLANIEKRDVKRWITALRKKPVIAQTERAGKSRNARRHLSRQSVVHALNLLRKCLQDAVDDDEILKMNVARGVKVPKENRTDEGWTFLSTEEIGALASCEAIPQAQRWLFTVAIHTGLREGELWGLHWSDVRLDGERPEIVVRFSHRGTTKSGRIRHVPLLEPARVALEHWKKHCPKTPEGLVFPTESATRRQKSDDAGWSHRKLKDRTVIGWRWYAGIKRRVRFHDLRHTCASHLIMGSWGVAWSLYEVKEFLGHSDIKTTERYAHLSPEHLHRKAAQTASSRGPRLGHELGHAAVPRSANGAVITRARDTGFEPVTFGSGGQHRATPVSVKTAARRAIPAWPEPRRTRTAATVQQTGRTRAQPVSAKRERPKSPDRPTDKRLPITKPGRPRGSTEKK